MSWLRRKRRWSVVTAAPGGEAGEQWGDTHFARDLVAALNRQGVDAKVVSRGGADKPARDDDDVVVVLRGLKRITPRPGKTTWIEWVISHPELVDDAELAEFEAVCAASETWRAGQVIPLLQATDPSRFTPQAATADSGDRILFVGSTRGQFRPIVRDALEAGVPVSVYGVGWEEYLAPEQIAGAFLANEELPAAYAGAGIVLNDHWPEMAEQGFLSNRLFDAVASGARVISDQASGLGAVFGDAVITYSTPEELRELLTAPIEEVFADRVQRLAQAERIAVEHSFDARAAQLIEIAEQVRR